MRQQRKGALASRSPSPSPSPTSEGTTRRLVARVAAQPVRSGSGSANISSSNNHGNRGKTATTASLPGLRGGNAADLLSCNSSTTTTTTTTSNSANIDAGGGGSKQHSRDGGRVAVRRKGKARAMPGMQEVAAVIPSTASGIRRTGDGFKGGDRTERPGVAVPYYYQAKQLHNSAGAGHAVDASKQRNGHATVVVSVTKEKIKGGKR